MPDSQVAHPLVPCTLPGGMADTATTVFLAGGGGYVYNRAGLKLLHNALEENFCGPDVVVSQARYKTAMAVMAPVPCRALCDAI